MNTTEKRKLEGIILSKIDEAKQKHSNRRDRERSALRESLVDNPPQEVEKLAGQLVKIKADYAKNQMAVKDKATKLGYSVDTNYNGEQHISLLHDNGNIKEFDDATTKLLQKLDDMRTDYTVTLWSENGDMAKMLNDFNKDLSAVAV